MSQKMIGWFACKNEKLQSQEIWEFVGSEEATGFSHSVVGDETEKPFEKIVKTVLWQGSKQGYDHHPF